MFRRHRRSTEAGPTIRHVGVEGDVAPAPQDNAVREAFDRHVTEFLGPCTSVFHEIVSEFVHVDVYVWAATPDRPMHTFITSGMSDLPMHVPPELAPDLRADRAELVVCVPADWPVPSPGEPMDAWGDERFYFPIRGLKSLARLPHQYRTWLGIGHTVPNGDPPGPFAAGTELCGWAVLPVLTLPQEFGLMRQPGSPPVEFFGIVALHAEEMEVKRREGIAALFEGFERHDVSELVRPDRGICLR